MNSQRDEIIGENFRWLHATSEIEHIPTGSRRPDSAYDAKVDVYQDRVMHWFLDVARSHVLNSPSPGDYVALAVAVAYIEGVEQYRRGKRTPRWKSTEWFKAGAQRIFPRATAVAVDQLWIAVRNGLFHDGFTKGPTLVSPGYPNPLSISGRYLLVNPQHFVGAVIRDFDAYIETLRTDPSGDIATKFVQLWDEQWKET